MSLQGPLHHFISCVELFLPIMFSSSSSSSLSVDRSSTTTASLPDCVYACVRDRLNPSAVSTMSSWPAGRNHNSAVSWATFFTLCAFDNSGFSSLAVREETHFHRPQRPRSCDNTQPSCLAILRASLVIALATARDVRFDGALAIIRVTGNNFGRKPSLCGIGSPKPHDLPASRCTFDDRERILHQSVGERNRSLAGSRLLHPV